MDVNGQRNTYDPIDVVVGSITGIERLAAGEVPDKFDQLPAFPNPFNPQTTIQYLLPQDGFVSLQVFDLTGRLVSSLVEGTYPAGEYQATWNAIDFPSGTYLIVLQAGVERQVQKVVLLK